VRLLAGGNNSKGAFAGKGIYCLETIFTQPCFPAPKAYSVMFVTLAQKLTAKI